tara:strand:+ start:1275 stop:1469 length:195 start_codon:yes stop_codon:yes gene_type:complete
MKYKIEQDKKDLTGCGFTIYSCDGKNDYWNYVSPLFVYVGSTDDEIIKLAKETLLKPRTVYFAA